MDLFTELARIERSIANGSCTEALSFCGENRGSLKKAKVSLISIALTPYALLLVHTSSESARIRPPTARVHRALSCG